MEKTTTTPRRPIVPGPTNQGIAAKAIALREGNTLHDAAEKQRAERVLATRNREPSPILPFQGVGNLAKGIASVMAEVGTIQKTGFNKFHNYAYATLQDLLFAVTPLMGKYGVCVIQNEVERTQVETRILVTYEFSIFHTSGEIWPDRPRFTGMCNGRNSKGDYDEKAINKCHSGARKYFLLSLFQVPSGDFDDADEGPPQQAVSTEQPKTDKRPRTVPGPTPKPTTKGEPHKILLGAGGGADKWATEYLNAIAEAKSQQEITEWDGLNDSTLQALSDKYPEVYERIRAASEQRMEQLTPQSEITMPDPKKDAQEAMNWIAQSLLDAMTYDTAEVFWNSVVAPREKEFDPADWELLMNEWRRAEIRLNPSPVEDDPIRSETDKDV
jgi:hypothetical protein